MGRATHTDSRDASDPSLMIIADDLSGATDSAVACAVRGLDTIVALGELEDFGTAEAVAFDVDTRRLTRNAAMAETARFVRTHAKASNRVLFKKVDSTLRGHVGPEIAALLDTLRHLPDYASGRRTIAILAPAFPALARTTVGGKQRLNGVPLEDTELWRREGMTGEACLLDMMNCAGLESKLVPLGTIRAGADAIRAAMADVANRIDVLVCDAETEQELTALAHASLDIPVRCVWVGSAGLIGPLVDAADISRRKADVPQLISRTGPLLFVIGSQSSVSHRQAELLAAEDIVTLTIEEVALDKEAASLANLAARFAVAFANGKDVLLLSASKVAPARFEGDAFWAALRDLITPYAGRIGGLFVTGGETAHAVLASLGVTTLRPVVEIEHGIPLSIAGGPRPFLVITKAGAFGKVDTMLNCRRALHECATATFVPTFFSKVQR